ncbi:TetR family transcriptional regulator [Tetragenococcus koreensis]|uniref:TetR family transcriptional regulator n=1 Tax=Tetragenococcus koreensis TaxID=290335 RepID=A0AAN4ZTC2_9ENTE|nr:TetR family transcriptional regulator [Tetragenococcus koreensis]AYW45790.1 TetR/AcrR family transcriptional regulator [Tetragenococcus koreensis]MCF1585920.1 TetR family transcriptional regulator [Tetragenococcus koreensis]MCF1615497.1 TetR family transcriptional regulator [Tetragenococcus koreensis]MCF1617573.1 TetR family transcriptional regulator [Tetragenococcus koreensis]MCF1620559.1 TetR family transcriptional regulator [Tetragenococcus koreensis]
MPYETFFNLPDEKQKRILEAAKKEFSQSALKDASIADIVKDAEISRGSFYQYFADIEDLYLYYFHTLGKDNHKQLLLNLRQHQGDLFATFDDFFSHWILEIFKGENVLFYKNLFTSMDYRGMHKFMPFADKKMHRKATTAQRKKLENDQKAMLEAVDRTLLDVKSEQELQLLLQLLIHITFSTIADGYRYHFENGYYSTQQISKDFRLKLNWLKNGAQRDKKVKENNE